MDTQPGQSGAPVYRYNGGDRRVIGVHAYGGSGENYARVITKGAGKSLCTWIGKWPSIFRDHSCY